MKAMILETPAPAESNPLKIRDIPVPSPGEGEIRVKVEACGVCRTDLHIAEGDIPFRLPVVPGHQIVGIVDEIGSGVSLFSKGERVGIAWLRHACGFCAFCKSGKENLCKNAKYTGYDENGGYAEYAIVNEGFAYKLPDSFSSTHAAPLLCAGIIGYRCLKLAKAREAKTLALYGFGASAHIAVQVAKYWGCRVYVVTRSPSHAKLAKDLGADWAGENPKNLPSKTESAIIFAPAGSIIPSALEMLEKGGTLALAGIHMTDIPSLNYEKHLFYEKTIRSVTANTRSDAKEFLDIASKIPVRTKVIEMRLEEANEALAMLKKGVDGAIVLKI